MGTEIKQPQTTNRILICPLFNLYIDFNNPLSNTKLEDNVYIKRNNRDLDKLIGKTNSNHLGSSENIDKINETSYILIVKYRSENYSDPIPLKVMDSTFILLSVLRLIYPNTIRTSLYEYTTDNSSRIPIVINTPFPETYKPPTAINDEARFSKSDRPKIVKYYKKLKDLYSDYKGKYNKVLNACIFFEMGNQNREYKQRIVNYVTALESLFNNDRNQINYSLRIRCSHFLEKEPGRKEEMNVKIKKIYELRSAIIHGQDSSKGKLKNLHKDRQEANDLIIYCENLVRRCIQKILDKEKILEIFNNSSKLDTEFTKLEMGSKSALK